MADGSSEVSAEESNPGLRTPPTVSDSLMKTLKGALGDIVEDEEERCGLAVVMGNNTDDLLGVKQDLTTMKEACLKQNLAVWKMADAGSAQIAGTVQAIANHTFPPRYEVLIFYFCGLAGSQNEHSYIKCGGVDTLSIEKGIISPLQGLQLEPLFLFDCCLENNAERGAKHLTRFPKEAFPSTPRVCNVHMALSTCATSSDRVGGDGGGVLTRFLANLLKGRRHTFNNVLHRSTRETVSHHRKRHEKELKEGKMSFHGPNSGNDEEVDFPDQDGTIELVCHEGRQESCDPEADRKCCISVKSPQKSK